MEANAAFWRPNFSFAPCFRCVSLGASSVTAVPAGPPCSGQLRREQQQQGLCCLWLSTGAQTCRSGCPPLCCWVGMVWLSARACQGLGLASSSRQAQPQRRGQEQPCPCSTPQPRVPQKQSPSVDASKPQTMKPSETRSTPTTKAGTEKNTQSDKPTDSQNKQLSEEKQKEPSDGNNQTTPTVTTASKPNNTGKVTTTQAGQPPPATSTETPKQKSTEMSTVTGAAAGTGTAGASVAAAADKSSTEPGMDESALDSLIDTLGGPEEDVPTTPVYTGPEITEDIYSRYLEELGKREGSLPPEYVKLLKSKGYGKDVVPPKPNVQDEKPMTDDELADALSSDFTCSAASAQEKTSLTEKPNKEGETVQAQAASSVKTSVPPKEKKTKSKEEMKDDAMDALLDTLGGPEPEPEEDPTPVVEVSEAKAKEKKEQKAGEHDDTIPPEYRLTPELDKDGKPILLKPEEKPKPMSESDLVDEFSKDFACPAQPAVQPKAPKPSNTSKKQSGSVSAKATEDKVVSRATACTVQSAAPVPSVGPVSDEALEALSSSLGKREPDPDEKKPAVDKVKEKTKKKQHKKLGEEEETIPPEYRLTETKDKDGKPLLPKPEEKSQPMSENDLLEGLTEGFSCSPSPPAPLPTSTVLKKSKDGAKPASSSDVISAATVSSVHSAAPAPSTTGGKEMDEALDLLSDSLGQREPDPDENKPVVDKVKEKAKSEHRDKLGERDETIPPDYRKLLESGEQSKPAKPTAKDDVKHKGKKKPVDDSAAIDALSGDFDTCAKAPATPQPSKDKSGKESTTTKPSSKDKGKPREPKTAKGQSSSSKSEKQKAS
ncbi:calpastatin isoform X2 [Onychostruthus taczanowskii]|uniref:calpastatin isoform X2 n=1 Tax=Onychostruthus taczanowskii TaxID=356909 RepID=UPI001B8047FB|nr:calpastatin isoform X2 [Onychostruthus taczanowskii]